MSAEPKPIIFVSIYMPFYDSSNRVTCLSETLDAIAMLEEVITNHPLHSFVIGEISKLNFAMIRLWMIYERTPTTSDADRILL